MTTGIIDPMRIRQRLERLHRHPEFALVMKILRTLQDQGFATVLAGGCVRDSLLGLKPKDLDIATAAPPEIVERSFPQTLAVGKAFGTIVVIANGKNFEVTTFRKDGPYLDGRHPSHVSFTDMHEDASRRDFTINALFYDPIAGEVIDFVDGIPDLQDGILRAVGDPEERFNEDRLRMLRAIRFASQLGFALEDHALYAIQTQYQELKIVSAERIFNEVRKLLMGDFRNQGLQLLLDSHLHKVFWPEIEPLQSAELKQFPTFLNWENAFAAIALLCKMENSEARLRSWKVSRDNLRRIQLQMDSVKMLLSGKTTRASRARLLSTEVFAEILVLSEGLLTDRKSDLEIWIKEYLELTGPAAQLPSPLITGKDLLEQGIEPGERMGKILKSLFEAQLEGQISTRDQALQKLKNY